ncbi:MULTISPECIES: biotin--[acetyl-CoA-carboxylase] ligase [Nitrosomonas]|uniref:Bifunctional ligase/repressor BirA n=1 Tax=Nitrosomonas communis TaxID=44574 RepID=A0A0F7KCW9_9PROT|nr:MULTISPECIES: biotin--[acetyl-CoA-carboxylase] ligase [Nitrosomonas]AKH37426.1 biotin--acetyl-CoA-carboxylase ligase [Nitrosomonas communis]TYP91387.1 BirA family biotin operon repressor/biotin-[acetyl-CoA-carboxylase] ligase [Nitrosomonas communis]UVS62653.1 biotin--[acetyl-CoA-carboxylase] ligase [Nitrosomonas sp. PLL12]
MLANFYIDLNVKSLTFAILRRLSDGEFHSGTELSQILGMSRSSISNALHDLDRLGLVIHKIQGRGYRWLNPVQWLNTAMIQTHLAGESDRFHIQVIDITESTNTLLLHEITRNHIMHDGKIHVIAAELQTQGRGRRGRQWYTGLGDSLTFSLSWQFQRGVNFLSGLSLAIGVAIVRALMVVGIKGVTLKWPNDLLFEFIKLGGVLIELQGDMLGPATAVIGIGINLRLPDHIKNKIDQETTDLYSIVQEVPDRNKLLAVLLGELVATLNIFDQKGFSLFKDEWIRYHAFENKLIELHLPNGSIQLGIARGVAPDGSLLVNTLMGEQSFHGGEISLRKLD